MTNPLLTSLPKANETNRGTMDPRGPEGMLDLISVVNGVALWRSYDLEKLLVRTVPLSLLAGSTPLLLAYP